MNEVAVARPRVLTVIVSYNFEPWIERCLSSIRDSDYPSDLVVIDNASTDRTVSIIAERYRWIRLVRSRKNLGFGQANNIGMRMALEEDYDYVFLVNQDAWIEANTVGTWVGLAEKYPDYGVLSPVHLDGKGEHLDGSFAKYVGGASAVSSKKSDIVEAAFVNAAFWFIPVPALKKVGGFSPLFFHYGEDVDYIRRMRFYGYRVGYTPLTSGCHDRKNRPITRQIQMKLDRVYYLSVVSDLNSGMAKCLWGGVLAPLKPGVLALLRGRFKEFCFYTGTSVRLLCRYPSIAEIKRFCKHGRPVFLENVHSRIKPIWS